MARRNIVLVSRTLYQIGVITLIAALMWVAVGIYSVSGQEFKTEIDKEVLAPLNPNLDQATIQQLTGRIKVEEDFANTSELAAEIEQAAPEDVEIDVITTPDGTTVIPQGDIIFDGQAI